MDRIYKIGGHCFALPDERLMEAVDGISGFKPFSLATGSGFGKRCIRGCLVAGFYCLGGKRLGFSGFYRESPMGSDMKM